MAKLRLTLCDKQYESRSRQTGSVMTFRLSPSGAAWLKHASARTAWGLAEGMRILFFVSPFLLSLPQLARADAGVSTSETIAVEEITTDEGETAPAPNPAALAQFGPFSVVSANMAELNGVIDDTTPDHVRRMLTLYPGITLIRMIDCPGTEDDEANLEVARMIHRAGISTFVPRGGSVRSGGVELFLAGVHRTAEPGAEFGVHSWQDDEGREARDMPANDPANMAYLRYYQDVGLTADQARAFYAFTNRAAFDNIHYMTASELAQFHILN